MTSLPERPIGEVRKELKGKVGPKVRTVTSRIYDLARRGRSPTQIVTELGLSQTDIQDVATTIRALGLNISQRHQYADLSKVREELKKKLHKK